MGPPLKAAENGQDDLKHWVRLCSFNGAAAKSSGKYGTKVWVCVYNSNASMGPPLKAAENIRRVRKRTKMWEKLQWGRR